MLVYVGTYTGTGSRGIYLLEFDPDSGKLTARGLAAEARNPSFLALAPSGRFLYAVNENEVAGGKPAGAVSAFAVDPLSGALSFLNRQPSEGLSPCHLAVAPDGRGVVVANYESGTVASLPIEDDGRLGPAVTVFQYSGHGPVPERQEASHAHSATFAPGGETVFVADLGADRLMAHRYIRETGEMEDYEPGGIDVAAGAGPRHMAFHPSGRWAYVVNELDSTVTAFAVDSARGVLSRGATVSTLPGSWRGENTGADLHMAPSGRFLYASNRGHDSLAVYVVDAQDGTLALVGHQSSQGKVPRNFALDPTGRFLLAASQGSSLVAAFRLDVATGMPVATGSRVSVDKPVCVVFGG